MPKCLERKRKRCGIGSPGKRRAMIGKEHAKSSQPPEALVASSALTQRAQYKDEKEGEDMERETVGALVVPCAAGWLVIIALSALEFCME